MARRAAFRGRAPASPSRRKSGRPRFSTSSSCKARPSRSRRRSAGSTPDAASSTRSPTRRKSSQRNVGARDRSRLDQYFTSVRDLEHRLQESREWERKPKPVVNVAAPVEPASPAQYMDKVKAMYDLARLAFETDSTRAITLMLNSVGTPVVTIPGETITDSYHNLSHHGKAEEKLAQLKVLDEWHMKLLANLFSDLKAVSEGGETPARSHHDPLRLEPRRRQRPFDDQPADAVRRRRFPARPASRLRPGAKLSAAESFRFDAPADGIWRRTSSPRRPARCVASR